MKIGHRKSADNASLVLGIGLGIPLCLVLGVVELQRAFDGNRRSWVYVFEWPFFGIFIYYMYWKLSQPIPDWENEDNKNPRRELEE